MSPSTRRALLKRLRTRRAVIETQHAGNVTQRDAAHTKWNDLDREVRRLQGCQQQRAQLQRELNDLVQRKERRFSLVQAQTQRRDAAEAEVASLTEQAASTRHSAQIARRGKSAIDGVKPEIFALGRPVYDAAAQYYSDVLCDGAIRVALNPERDSTGSILRISGASAPTYKGCSAGERRRIALINALASRELARWRAGGERVNVCIYDEIFDPLDDSGVDRAMQVLERDVQELETVFCISHNTRLKERFPGARTLRVIRENGIAHVEFEFVNRDSTARPRRTAV